MSLASFNQAPDRGSNLLRLCHVSVLHVWLPLLGELILWDSLCKIQP